MDRHSSLLRFIRSEWMKRFEPQLEKRLVAVQFAIRLEAQHLEREPVHDLVNQHGEVLRRSRWLEKRSRASW